MSHYIILHQSYSRFLFPNLTWIIPSLSCLARCARRERVNEPSPKLRPRVVYFQAARNPPTTSLACLRIWLPPCPSRADSPDAGAGNGVPQGGSHGGRGPPQRPSGLHPHHPRDAATPTVSAADACVMRQGVDGSSLWRLFRAFPG